MIEPAKKVATLLAILALFVIPDWAGSAVRANDSAYSMTLIRGSRLMIAAKINGHAVTALLDSAAEARFIDSDWVRGLNLKDGQEVSGQGSGNASFSAKLVNV
jgi:hypothetical protein